MPDVCVVCVWLLIRFEFLDKDFVGRRRRRLRFPVTLTVRSPRIQFVNDEPYEFPSGGCNDGIIAVDERSERK